MKNAVTCAGHPISMWADKIRSHSRPRDKGSLTESGRNPSDLSAFSQEVQRTYHPLSGRARVDLKVERLKGEAALAGLKPTKVWTHFYNLTRIPRPSGHEQGVRAYLEGFALARRNIQFESDSAGNVLFRVNADAPGKIIALQCHQDMVCVAKEGKVINFLKDPIVPVREGDDLYGDDTSLGGDNGIGCAVALAVAEQYTGPLEILFTSGEEVGFTGVEKLSPSWLKADTLINLDWESADSLTVGAAGAQMLTFKTELNQVPVPEGHAAYSLSLSGLVGGHSGLDIHRSRNNAIKVLARGFAMAAELGGSVATFNAGAAPNAIPTLGTALLTLPVDSEKEFRRQLGLLEAEIATPEDSKGKLVLVPSAAQPGSVLATADLNRLCLLVDELPNGVLRAHPQNPKQPQLSNNLGVAELKKDGSFSLQAMSRSPFAAELHEVARQTDKIAKARGAQLEAGRPIPGWEPNPRSQLLTVFNDAYEKRCRRTPAVIEVHAGLECGAIQGKYPAMDIISMGPTIAGAHSVSERASVRSVERAYELLLDVLNTFSERTEP